VSRNLTLLLVFLSNLIAATIGPAILEAPFVHMDQPLSESVLRADYLSAASALGLGYLIRRTWRNPSAKWVWIAGFVWMAQRIFVIGPHIPVLSCGPGVRSCTDWITYTIPCIRTACYSCGALLFDRLEPRPEEAVDPDISVSAE
jgi:hypothetical protein